MDSEAIFVGMIIHNRTVIISSGGDYACAVMTVTPFFSACINKETFLTRSRDNHCKRVGIIVAVRVRYGGYY